MACRNFSKCIVKSFLERLEKAAFVIIDNQFYFFFFLWNILEASPREFTRLEREIPIKKNTESRIWFYIYVRMHMNHFNVISLKQNQLIWGSLIRLYFFLWSLSASESASKTRINVDKTIIETNNPLKLWIYIILMRYLIFGIDFKIWYLKGIITKFRKSKTDGMHNFYILLIILINY